MVPCPWSKAQRIQTEILLGTRQNTRNLSPVTVRVGGETVQESRTVKNLGVLFDRHLSWDAHVSDVVRHCTGLLIGLRHLRHFLPQHVMKTVIDGLVISRVRYCISVYGNCSVESIVRLLEIINFATRIITGLKKYDHVSHARDDLHLLSASQMYRVSAATVAHGAILRGEPADLASLFVTNAAARVMVVTAPPVLTAACGHQPCVLGLDSGLSRTKRQPF